MRLNFSGASTTITPDTLYTSNLGLAIDVFNLGRKHNRFRGSTKGAGGARKEQGGARREHGAQHKGRSTGEPEFAAS